ncbi:hypothetical protein RF638_04360 [Kocuria sp. CPCC 205235]|uniref:hypothetical protein n=1 Tax=Kocuria sp. CPCC 205235 TaxID=3073549 RepID=UPI0034D3F31C
MSESTRPRVLRPVTIEIPGEVIEDVNGVPAYVGETQKFSGSLFGWDEILEAERND